MSLSHGPNASSSLKDVSSAVSNIASSIVAPYTNRNGRNNQVTGGDRGPGYECIGTSTYAAYNHVFSADRCGKDGRVTSRDDGGGRNTTTRVHGRLAPVHCASRVRWTILPSSSASHDHTITQLITSATQSLPLPLPIDTRNKHRQHLARLNDQCPRRLRTARLGRDFVPHLLHRYCHS
jgi:hypothetical protein